MDFQFQHLAALHTIANFVARSCRDGRIHAVSTSVCFVSVEESGRCSSFVYNIDRAPFIVPNMGDSSPQKNKRLCVYLKWEQKFPWLKSVSNNRVKAKCVHCKRDFSTAHGGESGVKQHAPLGCMKIRRWDLYRVLKVIELLLSS
jgi:hypothetical protein